MRHLFNATKEEAFKEAKEKAQRTSTDYFVAELPKGYAVGTVKQINFHYPEALGWNVRFTY